VQRIITLQYNPDSLSRSLQIRGAGGDAGDRQEAMRLTGPPVETITVEAELDAADQIAEPGRGRTEAEVGLLAQLAALEAIVYPQSNRLQENHNLAARGSLEIIPAVAPLTLFVWSRNRVLPVRITSFSITEEAFDTQLNPIRARVSLSLRVLTTNDLGIESKGGSLFLVHHQQKERLAARHAGGTFTDLGIGGIP
jgi:hypothetical protein